LVHNGKLVAAVEEERFNRVRHGKPADLKNPHWLPEQSIRYCLAEAGLESEAITHIGYSFAPELRIAGNVAVDSETTPEGAGTVEGEERFYRLLRQAPQRLSLLLGQDVRDRFRWIEHHLCHAASAFFVSPFEDAAVLSVDGIGEAATTWLGRGQGNRLHKLAELRYPNSLGLLWTKLSRFLGFGNYGQWKVMALAAYGDPDRFYPAFRTFVEYDGSGSFEVDGRTLQFRIESCAAIERLLGPRRGGEEDPDDRFRDIAAALQRVTNEALLGIASRLKAETDSKNLCLAGGVALNCVANRLLLEEGGFEDLFVQPAANDGGTALGACYYLWNQVLGGERVQTMEHAYLGPSFARDAACLLSQVNPEVVSEGSDLPAQAARLIAQGSTVALFQGRMEFGPRALGNRSILADPRRADMVQLLNDKVKRREWFRPFAASVLAERAREWFAIERRTFADRFMVLAYPVRPEKQGLIPAVTHVDGTTRLQTVERENNPVFYRVIEEFARITGVPLVLNTSLNESEPIVCSPADALRTCLKSGVDYLVIEGRIVDVARCHASVAELLDVTPPLRDSKPLPQPPPNSADSDPAMEENAMAVFMSR
jgi:carbamoyltransferase